MDDDSKSWEYLAFEIMVLLKYATSSEFQCVDEESKYNYFIIFLNILIAMFQFNYFPLWFFLKKNIILRPQQIAAKEDPGQNN